ncbi:hypothetical protein [Paraburkholderia phenoliruptrix]|uniref:hypothetical protein n=1 Tax=Paraburkholderia phenoliruptrix TaxID=252970 RepID=UPI001CB771EE|nr:hypothetical protein [Paraburkholderia phenoliruptrix]
MASIKVTLAPIHGLPLATVPVTEPGVAVCVLDEPDPEPEPPPPQPPNWSKAIVTAAAMALRADSRCMYFPDGVICFALKPAAYVGISFRFAAVALNRKTLVSFLAD